MPDVGVEDRDYRTLLYGTSDVPSFCQDWFSAICGTFA